MATVSTGTVQERRRRPVFRTLCSRGGAPTNAQLHAKEVRGADLRSRRTDGTRVEIVHLSGADAPERDRRRDLSTTGVTSCGISRGPFTRNDCRTRGRNAEGGGEAGFRESGRTAQHAGGSAAHNQAHPAL